MIYLPLKTYYLKCPTLVSLHSPGLFISYGVPSSLKASFESELGPWTLTWYQSQFFPIVGLSPFPPLGFPPVLSTGVWPIMPHVRGSFKVFQIG